MRSPLWSQFRFRVSCKSIHAPRGSHIFSCDLTQFTHRRTELSIAIGQIRLGASMVSSAVEGTSRYPIPSGILYDLKCSRDDRLQRFRPRASFAPRDLLEHLLASCRMRFAIVPSNISQRPSSTTIIFVVFQNDFSFKFFSSGLLGKSISEAIPGFRRC